MFLMATLVPYLQQSESDKIIRQQENTSNNDSTHTIALYITHMNKQSKTQPCYF